MPETQTRRTGTCAHCVRPDLQIHARGLCSRCYQELGGFGGRGTPRRAPDPMFLEYAPRTRATADTVEDYLFIRRTEGGTLEQIAARLGMHEKALYSALWRAGVKP